MTDGPTPGISRGGDDAEQLFREITGAKQAPKRSDGDAVLEGNLVEIKQTRTNTLNQVRALKYLPLVVYDTRRGAWYVVPAHELVRVVTAKKIRGQHSEIAYECAGLNLTSFVDCEVPAANLRERTLRAIESSAAYPELRDEMLRALQTAKATAAEIREQVEDTLRRLGLET